MTTRRDVVGSLLAMMSAASTANAASGSAAWHDAVFTLDRGQTTHASFGETTVYFEGKTDTLKSMTAGCLVLNPGAEPHPPHHHPEEEFLLIAEGSGEILVHGATVQVGPGSLMYSESEREHGIKNTGTTPMRFYFFKWLAA